MKAISASIQKVCVLGAAAEKPRVVFTRGVLKGGRTCRRVPGIGNGKNFSHQMCKKAGLRKATSGALATVASSRISFKLPFKVSFGVMLRLVGSAEELGEWSTGDGVDFQWTEGHNWVLDIDAPKCGSFEYKIVAFNTITGSVVWESCENRFLESDETDKKVELLWNTPTKTKIALIEAGHSLEVDVTVVDDLDSSTTWNAEGAIDEESGIDTSGTAGSEDSDFSGPSSERRERSVFSSVVEASQVPSTSVVQDDKVMEINPDPSEPMSTDLLSSNSADKALDSVLDAEPLPTESGCPDGDENEATNALDEANTAEDGAPIPENSTVIDDENQPSSTVVESSQPTAMEMKEHMNAVQAEESNPVKEETVLKQEPTETELAEEVPQEPEFVDADPASKGTENAAVETAQVLSQQVDVENEDHDVPYGQEHDGSIIYTAEMLKREIDFESMGLPDLSALQPSTEPALQDASKEAAVETEATEESNVATDGTEETRKEQVVKKTGEKSFGSALALAALGVSTVALGTIGLEITDAVAAGAVLVGGTAALLAIDDKGREKNTESSMDRSVDRADEEDLYPESKIKEAATPGVFLSALMMLPLVAGAKILDGSKKRRND